MSEATHHLVSAAANLVTIHRGWQLRHYRLPCAPGGVLLGSAGPLSNRKDQLLEVGGHKKMVELGLGIALQDVICTVSHSCVSLLLLKKKIRVFEISQFQILSKDGNPQGAEGLR